MPYGTSWVLEQYRMRHARVEDQVSSLSTRDRPLLAKLPSFMVRYTDTDQAAFPRRVTNY